MERPVLLEPADVVATVPPLRRRRRRWLAVPVLVVAAAAAAGHGVLDDRGSTWQTVAAANALGMDVSDVHLTAVREVPTATGQRVNATVAGVGLVQFDAVTHEVDQIVFEANLGGSAGPTLTADAALGIARQFAAAQYAGFDALVPHANRFIDHTAFAEYRVEWRARDGVAWLPSQVAVGVNARTGEIAYYWSERVAVRVPTDPHVTRAGAVTAAGRLVAGRATVSGAPRLEVLVLDGAQRLVWVVPARGPRQAGPHIPMALQIWVDALTGKAEIGAST